MLEVFDPVIVQTDKKQTGKKKFLNVRFVKLKWKIPPRCKTNPIPPVKFCAIFTNCFAPRQFADCDLRCPGMQHDTTLP